VPRLARVRRIIQEWPAKLRLDMKGRLCRSLLDAVAGYEPLCRTIHRLQIERHEKGQGQDVPFPEFHEAVRREVVAPVSVYLLAEFGFADALPALSKCFEPQRDHTAVSPLFVFYAMHLLVTEHPEAALSAAAKAARQKYLKLTRDKVPSPRGVRRAAWDAAVDETDVRVAIAKRQELLKHQPQVQLREYPGEFAVYEDHWRFLRQSPGAMRYRGTVAESVHEWYAEMQRFVTLAYPVK
jgi:hypothetical protein